MKETPILYSSDMVRAYLLGEKTLTRRTTGLSIINDPPQRDSGWQLEAYYPDGCARFTTPNGGNITLQCPYGGYGDKLWVKETWAIGSHSVDYPNRLEVLYKTTHDDNNDRQWVEVPFDTWVKYSYKNKWQSGRFMPKFASRLTQTISAIRVGKLQDITEEDAKAEGMPCIHIVENPQALYPDVDGYRRGFCFEWDKINGKTHPWKNKDWVWILEYPTYKETR